MLLTLKFWFYVFSTIFLAIGVYQLSHRKQPFLKELWEFIVGSIQNIGCLMVLVCIVYLLHDSVNYSFKRNKTLKYLRQDLAVDSISLVVDQDTLQAAIKDSILADLRMIRRVNEHHSSPQRHSKIAIITPEKTIHLDLYQDSNKENEYWVYWEYFKEGEHELGRIYSNILIQLQDSLELEKGD